MEQFKGVYVNPSRTFAERQKIKKLNQDLDEKWNNGEGEHWMIDFQNLTLKERRPILW